MREGPLDGSMDVPLGGRARGAGCGNGDAAGGGCSRGSPGTPSRLGCKAVGDSTSLAPLLKKIFFFCNAFFHFAEFCVVLRDRVLYFLCSHMDLTVVLLKTFLFLKKKTSHGSEFFVSP